MQESIDEPMTWAQALQGDPDAFTRLFRLHRDDVFRYARRLTDSPTDADDITASAFLELWHRRDAVRLVHGSVKPWLLVTAGNYARNHRRGTRRWRAVLHTLPRDHDQPDPSDIAGRRIDTQRGALAQALRRLPALDLSLLTLTVFEGYSVTDAAAVLGLTDTTARSRLSRARSRLRGQLQPDPAPAQPATRKQS